MPGHAADPSTPSPTWVTYRQAAGLFLRGVTLPSASRIALVVGTWLSFMNQGRLILDGRPPWIRIVLNYLTPFTVASLGYLAARRRRNVERLIALLEAGSATREEEGDGAQRGT